MNGWMNERINLECKLQPINDYAERHASRKINENQQFFSPAGFHYFTHPPAYLKSFKHSSSLTLQTPCQLYQCNAGIQWSKANLFVSMFVSLNVCVYGFFSSVFKFLSSFFLLVIFCLAAPNMPLSLSAVADTSDLYKCRKLQEIIKRASATRWQVALCKRAQDVCVE